MNKIKILSTQEAQKIAAGEVVERPSSVIKEIIENSIDAESTQINIYIENAGKNLIRIVDNGFGMSIPDAKLCFYPHATSKIETLDDLEKIQSFGFRGEALSSISAVSKIILITKLKNENELGIKLKYVEGKFVNEEKVSCSYGTDLQIKDLFYNTPVRKKFLKQDETEWNQILSVFNSFCLSSLDIHFKLYRDNKLILNLPSVENIQKRITQLWGHNFSQNLFELKKDNEKKDLQITGFISNHNFWRYGRHQIFFFTNKRYIKNRDLSKALLKGYSGVLPIARFPAAFVFINIKNDLVDINVHPRKEEVKFAKPKTIENYLQKLVKESLEENLTIKLETKNPDFNMTEKFKSLSSENIISLNKSQNESFSDFPVFTSQDFANDRSYKKESNFVNQDNFNLQKEEKIYGNKNISVNSSNFKIIGQFFKTYILFENEENLIIIDQHAAHERILYEKFLKNFESKEGTKLLFPELLNLSDQQIKIILNEKNFFKKQGIEIEQFGKNQIAIKTSPPKIQNQSLKELIIETIIFIEKNEKFEEEVFRKKLNEHMHTQMACKAAVKAGDNLSQMMMEQIINELQKTNNKLTCPHGRPTTWILNKYQIEKNFKRK